MKTNHTNFKSFLYHRSSWFEWVNDESVDGHITNAKWVGHFAEKSAACMASIMQWRRALCLRLALSWDRQRSLGIVHCGLGVQPACPTSRPQYWHILVNVGSVVCLFHPVRESSFNVNFTITLLYVTVATRTLSTRPKFWHNDDIELRLLWKCRNISRAAAKRFEIFITFRKESRFAQ